MPRIALILAVLLAALVAGCGAGLPAKGRIEVGAGEPLTIGVVSALSGSLAGEGEGIANAALLAGEENAAVHGHQVAIEIVDGGCDPALAETAVAGLAGNPRLVGVVGPTCSPACVAAEPLLDDRAIVMLTPRCTDVAVTRQGYEGVLRTGFTDAVGPVAAAKFADKHLSTSDVFVVHDGTLYGRGLRDVVRLIYGKDNLAGSVEALEGTADYGSVVRSIKKSSAGVVYYAGFAEDAARFVRQLRDGGVTLPVILPDAVLGEPGFVTLAGPSAEGVYITQPVPRSGRSYSEFAAAYHRRFGADPGPYAAEAYDAVKVLLRAVEQTAEVDDGRVRIDRRRFRAAARNTDLQGASGRIRFRPNGDRYEGVVVTIFRVHDGALVEETAIDPK